MPEEVFRFKNFEIIQNDLVHKVGTDGVLLGAWVDIDNAKWILDIGTGTGLIAIMLAQRSSGKAKILGIEINADAFDLASRNIANSKYTSSIDLSHSKLQDFKSSAPFDLIVCNPPFFINSLKPPESNRQQQRHTENLTFEEILTAITSLLSPAGKLGLILPVEEGKIFIDLAQNFGLNLLRHCDLFSREGKKRERLLLEFSYRSSLTQKSNLTIMSNKGEWTNEYQILTKDFYLRF